MMQARFDISPDSVTALENPLQFAFASRDADVPGLVARALDSGLARLAFQPVIVASDPGKVAFYEGLIRLLDDAGRVIPAAQFMPQVAHSDIGRRIDVLTLDLALRMLRKHGAAFSQCLCAVAGGLALAATAGIRAGRTGGAGIAAYF